MADAKSLMTTAAVKATLRGDSDVVEKAGAKRYPHLTNSAGIRNA